MNKRLAVVVMVLSIPVVWSVAVKALGLPSFILPPPGLVLTALRDESSYLLQHTQITLNEALMGYLVANAISISLALSFLYCSPLENFATPWLIFIRNIPFVTVSSILVITMGDSPASKLVIVILMTFYPILANLSKGLKSVKPVLLDRMQVLHASRWQIFRHIRLPSALPYFVAAHEISFTGSIVAAIVSEYMFSRKGLGYVILYSMAQYRADILYAATLICCSLSIGAYLTVKLIESRIFAWKRDLRD